jgi:uncharacterized protein (TIGR02145 family)
VVESLVVIEVESTKPLGSGTYLCEAMSLRSLQVLVLVIACTAFTGPASLQDWKVIPTDTLHIGRQVWMRNNVSVPMPNSFWYERDSLTHQGEGRLYFFSSALAACPKGWHLPSDEDWQELIDAFGGDSLAASNLLSGGRSGLNLTLAGYRSANSSNDLFGKHGEQGFYWTSTVKGEQTAYARLFTKGSSVIADQFYRRANAFSVRYVRDEPAY